MAQDKKRSVGHMKTKTGPLLHGGCLDLDEKKEAGITDDR